MSERPEDALKWLEIYCPAVMRAVDLRAYITQLEASLAEAKADSKRLDKLECFFTSSGSYPTKPIVERFLEALIECVEIREAIDKLEENNHE